MYFGQLSCFLILYEWTINTTGIFIIWLGDIKETYQLYNTNSKVQNGLSFCIVLQLQKRLGCPVTKKEQITANELKLEAVLVKNCLKMKVN